MPVSHGSFLKQLQHYVGEHGVVPSLATLAQLWGYASKASASRIVDRLVEEGALVRAQGGRLRPGPAFAARSGHEMDPMDRVASEWRDRWQPGALAEAYDLTTRIQRLATAMEDIARRTAVINGITVGELLVLDVLHRIGPPYLCAPTALKHHFALTLPGVGKRVSNLHRRGLIDRVRSEADGRSLLVALNDKGRSLLEKAATTDMQAPHIRWAMGLGSATRNVYTNMLRDALAQIRAMQERSSR